MSYEILVGLDIKNDQLYQKYRDEMKPILEAYGGRFRYDFKVSDVLLSETSNEINRVFTITFPDVKNKEAFFSDTAYLAIKKTYFEASVAATTIISSPE